MGNSKKREEENQHVTREKTQLSMERKTGQRQ